MKKPNLESIFDHTTIDGLRLFDTFIEREFIRYFHSHLISQYQSEKAFSIFVSDMQKQEEAKNFVAMFVAYVSSTMSVELKKLFYRYYNYEQKPTKVLKFFSKDKKEESRELLSNLEHYLSEWTALRLRLIVGQLSTSLGINDYSEEHTQYINSQLFTNLELSVYNSLGMIDLNLVPPKQTITKEDVKKVIS